MAVPPARGPAPHHSASTSAIARSGMRESLSRQRPSAVAMHLADTETGHSRRPSSRPPVGRGRLGLCPGLFQRRPAAWKRRGTRELLHAAASAFVSWGTTTAVHSCRCPADALPMPKKRHNMRSARGSPPSRGHHRSQPTALVACRRLSHTVIRLGRRFLVVTPGCTDCYVLRK